MACYQAVRNQNGVIDGGEMGSGGWAKSGIFGGGVLPCGKKSVILQSL